MIRVSIKLRTSLKRIVIDMFKLIVDNTVTEQESDSAFSNLIIRKYTAVYLSGILSPISPEVLEKYERRNPMGR